STRPNAIEVSSLEEMGRVVPVVEAVREKFPNIPISVDTFYPEVAQACIEVGADMINDVSCLSYDGMAEIIADTGVSVCVMHDRRASRIDDLFFDKVLGLENAVNKLLALGVQKDRILLDGGIGFNRNNDEDWELLRGYDRLMGDLPKYPFMLGTSRKSMFGGAVEDRLSATLDSTELAVKMGVLFVRVHEVWANKVVIDSYRAK
ncbi:MAG: dihydropteroate synthase, partial [Clostridia bacterium]|nr:dihydropteroate synthase [Clostridia bacterium]